MRKSEAIKILRKLLYKHVALDYNDINDSPDSMWKVIEGLGMLPPMTYTDEIDEDMQYVSEVVDSFIVWEPEE